MWNTLASSIRLDEASFSFVLTTDTVGTGAGIHNQVGKLKRVVCKTLFCKC